MPNQYKPTPPLDEIAPHILRLWKARLTDKQIVDGLQKHIDTEHFGLGLTKFVQIRVGMGLQRTRQQGHSIESIREAMLELRPIYPNAGARDIISLLFHEKGMCVARTVVRAYFATYEPELVRERKARRLKRKRFWAAGVNDLFAVDQHDKWLRFGLGLHTGIEPFSGRIMWIRVWHSNRNPQLILSYYLDTIQNLGHMPMVTQSDPGTENYGIANAHTMLRQWHDPALQGTLQHRWMRSNKNVMPEITWSQLRRRFTPGFESILEQGVNEGWYDSNNTLQVMVFRWVFVPWLQRELDAYQDRINNTSKRRDRNKVLPHGVPNLIYESPEDFGALDFKITVEQDAIDRVRALYIKPGHPVFDLVPPNLGDYIQLCYERMGHPIVNRGSVWPVYRDLLHMLQHGADNPTLLEISGDDDEESEELPLLDNYQDLPFNEDGYYMGGVGGGIRKKGKSLSHLTSLTET
ncbi:hypothetical protein DEU56DRAFT_749025 [Suillus clintonianus]|uniref:uncharacterized protein n=1 Tax=Suillus clintonianus TaxID=1904413 RepID=UPI001B85E0E0|nr:uncharacterized protein DEU56DRAFT_749025 [Suillus clintonianus]KAG2114133.1 hypothetical protein DEU56DRAFT_749025 [Suillus clintonianus]